MNEALKKTDKYQKRYMQKHRMLCVCLDKERDEDIIEWMNEQPCITASVKRILRWEINGRDDYENGSTARETPAGDQKTERSEQDNPIEISEDRLPEADPEDGKRAEGIRSDAQNKQEGKICANCRYSNIGICINEESEKGGSTVSMTETCGAWKGGTT